MKNFDNSKKNGNKERDKIKSYNKLKKTLYLQDIDNLKQ